MTTGPADRLESHTAPYKEAIVTQPYPYIAIEGVIGVGKTSLARLLQPRFGAELLLEVFEENPFLSDFYADRARYAFQTQIFFLLSRYRQLHQVAPAALQRAPLIADYTFAKDSLFAHLNLHGDELETYERLHEALAERIPTPNLVVYLRATTETLMARIAIRDRPYERGMDRGYIESLRIAYEQFFATYQEAPVLTIETDGMDFVRDPEALTAIEGQVRAALGEGLIQQPLPHMGLPQPAHLAGMRRLGEFQRRQERQEAVGGEPSDRYRSFLKLTEAVGRLGAALAAPEPQGERASLHQAMGDSLAALIRLANEVGMDLEAAYREWLRQSNRPSA